MNRSETNRLKTEPPLAPRSLAKLILSFLSVFIVAMVGQIATLRSLNEWYVDLVKPGFTPPNAIFPLAWSLLYALMAMSFWRILRIPAGTTGRAAAIGLFLFQLALNAAWSWAFFGWRSPGAGLIVIAALDLAVALTLIRFYRLDRSAGLALVPYLAWILFATVLNASILALN